MENAWLFPYRPFDVGAFLRRVRSPRLTDLPSFAQWIDEAARASDIRAEWLLGLAQKEQSFITRRAGGSGWQRALDWTMGFGATEGGDIPRYKRTRNQVFSAARGLRRYLTPGDSLYVGHRVGQTWRDLDGVSGTVSNLAAACALQYTPHWSTLQTVTTIWREFEFGEEENMATTGRDVAEIARRVCAEYATGNRGGMTVGQIHFELGEVSMCSEFVRECCEAAAGTPDHGPLTELYFGTCARHTERKLQGQGKRIADSEAEAGDIVCFNGPGASHYGHIGLWLDDGHTVAENTSSSRRGPGFVIRPLGSLAGRVSGTYRIFSPGAEDEPKPFRVDVLGTYVPADAAELRDGVTWVRLRDVADIAGWELFWRPELGKVFAKRTGEEVTTT